MWSIDRRHIYISLRTLLWFHSTEISTGQHQYSGTFVLNEKIYGLPFYHFHIAESFDEL